MIHIGPLSGFKYLTTFSVSGIPSAINPVIYWGDGEISYDSTSHIYSSYGLYDISVLNCSSLSSHQVSVYNGYFFTDKIEFTTNVVSGQISCPTTLEIAISSENQISTVYFYSSGSNSYSYSTDRNFWSHLNPEWKFISDDVITNEVEITGTSIYDSYSNLVGYSAIQTVDYIDDLPGQVKLLATLKAFKDNVQVNSNVFDSMNYSVCAIVPDRLFITSDGINPIESNQWADTIIPYTISVGSSQVSCTNIFHNISGYLQDIKFLAQCYGLDQSSFYTPICAMELNDGCFHTGGYIQNTLTVATSALPDYTITNNFEECNFDPTQLEFYKYKKTPKNVVLSATGKFLCNGIEYTLSGISDPFNVYPFENKHEFYRKGEDNNVYNILKSVLPFDTEQTPTFNSYLSAILGEGDSLGKVYDKVVNFIPDHSDIDVCDIDSLYDISYSLNDVIKDFNLILPEELKRAFHFSSIPLNKLIGSRCVCNMNFSDCKNCANSNVCSICKFDKRSNLGDKLTNTDFITAGETILYKENGAKTFNFFAVPQQNTSVYTLNSLSAEPFYSKGLSTFCFYRWDKTPQSNPVDSVINYKDYRNTLLPSLSTNDDWYKTGGVVDEIFEYVLTKNLIKESD